MAKNLSSLGKEVQDCITRNYPLLNDYYTNSIYGFLNIPYDEYENNKSIRDSVKSLMLGSSFDIGDDRLIWYMNILMLPNEDSIEEPYVSLALGNGLAI